MGPRVRILFLHGLKAAEVSCHVLSWHEAPLHSVHRAALCMRGKLMKHGEPGRSYGPIRLLQPSAETAALFELVLHLLLPHLQAIGACNVLRDALVEVMMPEC